MCLWSFFGLILAKNIEINKRPPLMTLLSALGSYWNEYGSCHSLFNMSLLITLFPHHYIQRLIVKT